MSALLTYRSRDSFESRFGRKLQDSRKVSDSNNNGHDKPLTPAEEALLIHNEGHKFRTNGTNGFKNHNEVSYNKASNEESNDNNSNNNHNNNNSNNNGGKNSKNNITNENNDDKNNYDSIEPIDTREWALSNNLTAAVRHTFSAQSYLRYQGDKFIKRFDANCYISLTRKMDSHDISRGRGSDITEILRSIKQPTCVFGNYSLKYLEFYVDFICLCFFYSLYFVCFLPKGIESDGLFTISEQYELAEHIPNSKMIVIHSPDGHDGFLLEFDQINRRILQFIRDQLPDITSREVDISNIETTLSLKVTKDSVFGEAEVNDMMKW